MIKNVNPWVKVAAVIGWLLLLGTLTVMGSDTELNLNLTPGFVLLMKILQAASVVLLFILPAILFSVIFYEEKIKFLQLHIPPKFILLLLAALTFVSALPFISWIEIQNSKMVLPESFSGLEQWMRKSEDTAKELTEAFLADTSVGGLILNLFVIAFMAGLSEEIFFRGALQKSLQQATKNIHMAVWISAILFSAFHLQFYGFIPRMLMGAVLGYVFAWGGSLWIPIFAHFTNNGVAVVLTWMAKNKMIDEDPTSTGEISFISAAISLVVASILLFAFYKLKPKKNGPEENNSLLDSGL